MLLLGSQHKPHGKPAWQTLTTKGCTLSGFVFLFLFFLILKGKQKAAEEAGGGAAVVQKADLEDATTPSLSFLFSKNRTKNGILKITEIMQ